MKLAAVLLAGALAGAARAAEPAPLNLTQTIPLPGVSGRFDHFAFDSKNHRLFVAALGNGTVEVIDYETGKRLQTISGCHEPQGLVFLPERNRLFVANGGSDNLKIFDGEKFQPRKTIGALADADNVRYDAAGGRVYVGFGSGALGVLDANGVRSASISLEGHPESFQIEPAGSRIFVNVPGDRSIAVIDRRRQSVVTKWRLDSAHANFPMALDETDHRLFIGCRSPARLLVLDTTGGKTVAQVEISGDIDDLFFDAKRQRLYLSCGEGFLDVVQRHAGDRYERIARQPTRAGARTCFYSPDLDRLYLAVPQRGGQDAEIRVYRPE